MKKAFWLFSAAALPILLVGGEPATDTDKKRLPTAEEIRARYTPEKLAKMRASLAARVTAYDAAEQGKRAPSAEEAAALAPAERGGTAAVRRNARGGMAIKGDQAPLEYVVVKLESDGTATQSHQTAPPAKKEGARNEKH